MGCCTLISNAEDFLTLKQDPTKTVGIRKRWIVQFNKRFTQLKGRINRLLIKGEEGAIPVPFLVNGNIVTNQFEFTNDATSVAEFMAWLQLQIDDLLFTNNANPSTIWQNKFIDQGYSRGVKRSKAELRKLGITAEQLQGITAAEIIGTATPSLGVAATQVLSPIHMDAIQLLYIREFDALKGITSEMSKQISRVMVEGIEQGLGIRDIAKNINNRVDKIGITRSKLLARTETARAYNIGTINEFDSVAKLAGVPTEFEWITAGDIDVRETHEDRNGVIFSKEEAFKLIGEPNCRCALKPHIDIKLLKAA